MSAPRTARDSAHQAAQDAARAWDIAVGAAYLKDAGADGFAVSEVGGHARRASVRAAAAADASGYADAEYAAQCAAETRRHKDAAQAAFDKLREGLDA